MNTAPVGRKLGGLMEAEMAEQPAALQGLLDRRADLAGLVETIAPDELRGIAFLARGSSDNAALLGRYAVELLTGLPTTLVAPSIATRYGGSYERFRGFLLVALSQSGRTPEIATVSQRFRADGVPALGVTNDPAAPLADAVDGIFDLRVGQERAIPATKTVTAQMLTLVLLADVITDLITDVPTDVPTDVTAERGTAARIDAGSVRSETAALPAVIATILRDSGSVSAAADRLADVTRMAVIGRGPTFPAALETALKLQETTGSLAHGYSAADYQHGPIATAASGTVPVLLAGGQDGDLRELQRRLTQLRQPFAVLGELGELSQGREDRDVVTSSAAADLCRAIEATVRGQQLALMLCRRRGIDPDSPANLNKVTATN